MYRKCSAQELQSLPSTTRGQCGTSRTLFITPTTRVRRHEGGIGLSVYSAKTIKCHKRSSTGRATPDRTGTRATEVVEAFATSARAHIVVC